MQCSYFDAGVCRSCEFMGQPYEAQLAGKVSTARAVLAEASGADVAELAAWTLIASVLLNLDAVLTKG
mgnify:CR=1 FL=1